MSSIKISVWKTDDTAINGDRSVKHEKSPGFSEYWNTIMIIAATDWLA